MAEAATTGREWRIDLFRGLALAMIFINHIPDNPLSRFTSANFGFSDAAEGFVLMAGLAAAMAYLPRLERNGMVRTTGRAWRRAFDLYVAHLLVVLLVSAMVGWVALAWDDPRFLAWINLGPVFDETAAALFGVVTLGHQPGFVNILPMYVCLLLLLPLMLPLAASRPGLLLAVSGAVWAGAGLFGINLPHYPNEDEWFFNPLSWQFLFAIGLVAGVRIMRGQPVVPGWRWLLPACLAFLAIAAFSVQDGLLAWPEIPELWFLIGLDKTYLPPLRLLHVLALAVVLARLPVAEAIAWLDRSGVLNLMGRYSLPVFCAGSVLAIAVQIARFLLDAGAGTEVMLVLGGLALQIGLARMLEWLDRDRRTAGAAARGPVVAADGGRAASGSA